MKNLNNPFVRVIWEDNPENFTQEKVDRVKSYFRKKYGTKRVNVITKVTLTSEGKDLIFDTSENILDYQYQKKLTKQFVDNESIDIDLDKLYRLDDKVNSKLDAKESIESRYRNWSIKWIEFDNFLCFGEQNKIDFKDFKGITTIDSIPSNFGGKTTVTVDLLLFLFFNTTTKTAKAIEIFNRFTDKNRVLVKGLLEIDGENYIIERGIVKKQTKKGDWTVKTHLNFYKLLKDGYEQNLEGEQRRETEQFIKKSIGTMDDFLMTILTTANNLEDLIEAKPTQRGQVLTRFIGLESLKEKEVTAKEMYSEWSKRLVSNMYNLQDLKLRNEELKNNTTELTNEIETRSKEVEDLLVRIKKGQEYKEEVLSKKNSDVDPELIKINPNKLKLEIVELEDKHNKEDEKLKDLKPLNVIGDFDEKIYKNKKDTIDTFKEKRIRLDLDITNVSESIKKLSEGENCPVCKRPLDEVDHTSEIVQLNSRLDDFTKEKKLVEADELKEKIEFEKLEQIKIDQEENDKITLLKLKYELGVEKLKSELKEKNDKLKDWEINKEKLEKNREIEEILLTARTKLDTLMIL
jgi:DNA repair exonuclease SbcCD ATPase subunit